jgi:patatin-like phospholipase/acyl hydrolase
MHEPLNIALFKAHRNSGGIRGIVELEVLREIELYLGGHIPIQAFFDLIVGTR